MEIKNKTIASNESIVEISLNAKNLKTINIILFIMGGIFLGLGIFFTIKTDGIEGPVIIGCGLFFLIFSLTNRFSFKKRTTKIYDKQLGVKGIDYDYTFSDSISVISVTEKTNSTTELQYDSIACVKEFNDYMLLFINNINFYIVSKNGFENSNDLNELITKLQSCKKYKRFDKNIIK